MTDDTPDVILTPRELSWLMGWFHDQDAETERNGLRLFGHIAALDERAARDAELVALLLAEARAAREAGSYGELNSECVAAEVAHQVARDNLDAAVQERLDAEALCPAVFQGDRCFRPVGHDGSHAVDQKTLDDNAAALGGTL